MDLSGVNAILVAASELAMASRWHESVELAERVVALAPDEHQAWWLLGQGYDKLSRGDDARHAYAQFYASAPKIADLRAMREFAALQAELPFDEADHADDQDQPYVMFPITIDGKQVLVHAQNDSGESLEDVFEAVDTFIRSVNPFEAWIYAQRHHELFTAIGDIVLSALAQSQESARARAGVERYRDALRRVRSGEHVAPFAEMAQVSESDFLAVVTAADDLQPLIQKLAEATSDEERWAIVGKDPRITTDHRTLPYVRILAGMQPEADARELMQSLFTFIRRARRGRAQSAVRERSPRLTEAGERAADAVGRGDLAAIDAALADWAAVDARDTGSDPSFTALNVGSLRLARYDRAGDAVDLDQACSTFGAAATADTDPDSPMLPYHHGLALLRRYERYGVSADLENAIAAMRLVLTLVVDGTRVEGAARSMLGAMLMRRAERTGDIADLDDSIAAQRLAVTAETGPEEFWIRLANLGTALVERFGMSGSVADLDEAEQFYAEALSQNPENSAVLGGLARLCRARHRVTSDPVWLDRAIETYRIVLAAADVPLDIALAYNNLSTSLRDRYLEYGASVDLEAAIESSRRALEIVPRGHVQRPLWLENLANHLRTRATHTGSVEDRVAAIAAFEEAIATAPEGSEVWRTAVGNLGGLLDETGDDGRSLELLELAFKRSSGAAASMDEIEAARGLGRALARRKNWSRAGEVLLAGLDALERLQRTQLSTEARKAWLATQPELHIYAAEVLLRAGNIRDALLAIERGRGRLLSDVLGRERAALAELERTGNQRLVERYRTAAEQVRFLTVAARRGQDVGQALVAATQALEAAIDELRAASGGAAFSNPMTIGEIVAAAQDAHAPLVYIIPLAEAGVAITVGSDISRIGAVVLPDLNSRAVDEMVERYAADYEHSVNVPDSASWDVWTTTLDNTVRWCWNACMRHVVADLGDVRDIVLVPVGRLGRLPLHAAVGSDGAALDRTNWRYAPNARTLARLGPTSAAVLLTVTFASEDAPPLPYASLETEMARRVFANHRALDGPEATRDAVVDQARHATLIHFACHAMAEMDDAPGSGLELADGVLSLQDLHELRLAKGTVAILSACETGIIGAKLPDEVLSIASAMLESGASAVVSSLWAVPDESTAILMTRLYFLWQREGRSPAAALSDAQRWMRDSDNGTIAAFLRAYVGDASEWRIIDELERSPSGATFRHVVHWGAFTYTGR